MPSGLRSSMTGGSLYRLTGIPREVGVAVGAGRDAVVQAEADHRRVGAGDAGQYVDDVVQDADLTVDERARATCLHGGRRAVVVGDQPVDQLLPGVSGLGLDAVAVVSARFADGGELPRQRSWPRARARW